MPSGSHAVLLNMGSSLRVLGLGRPWPEATHDTLQLVPDELKPGRIERDERPGIKEKVGQ